MTDRLLLDTHALVWMIEAPERIPAATRERMADEGNDVLVSAASAWEIATKVRLGRWAQAGKLVSAFDTTLATLRVRPLEITIGHGRVAGSLDWPHRDPFDRLLVAQAMGESLTLVTKDRAITAFAKVDTLW